MILLLGLMPLSGIATEAAFELTPNWSIAILVAFFLLRVAGTVAGSWPFIKYLLALVIVTVLAVLLKRDTSYGRSVRGALVGYLRDVN
ncbi:MAG: hypothetical protein AAF664_10445 [Planctomycetota bacterium]